METPEVKGTQSIHVPVLLHEVVDGFAEVKSSKSKVQSGSQDGLIYLDGTLGGAGHALAVAKTFAGKLTVIGLDRDMQAIERAKVTLQGLPALHAQAWQAGKVEKVILENKNYRELDTVLEAHSIAGVDLILLDLGYSSDELENSGRGFSFQKDEPLLMTLGDPKDYIFTAFTIVNSWDEENIADIVYGYGEDRFSRRIARAIVEYRSKKSIDTTFELAEIVKSAYPGFARRGKINPATKTFQAFRIAVNDELGALKEGLVKGFEKLNSGGRMAIISFHSLEDRIVKDFYKEKAAEGRGLILTKKPIVAGPQEAAENPRSRSAKLRIIEKIVTSN